MFLRTLTFRYALAEGHWRGRGEGKGPGPGLLGKEGKKIVSKLKLSPTLFIIYNLLNTSNMQVKAQSEYLEVRRITPPTGNAAVVGREGPSR